MKEEKQLIEAALFISSRAMSAEEFRTLTGIGALGYIRSVLDELKKEYEERGSALEVVEMDGKYVMRVRNEHLQRVKQFAQDTEISKSALRTLALISRNDGILKSALVRKMGTHAYGNVKELVDAGFVRAQKSGRSSKLTLTEKFKKYFTQEIPQQPAENEQTTL